MRFHTSILAAAGRKCLSLTCSRSLIANRRRGKGGIANGNADMGLTTAALISHPLKKMGFEIIVSSIVACGDIPHACRKLFIAITGQLYISNYVLDFT